MLSSTPLCVPIARARVSPPCEVFPLFSAKHVFYAKRLAGHFYNCSSFCARSVRYEQRVYAAQNMLRARQGHRQHVPGKTGLRQCSAPVFALVVCLVSPLGNNFFSAAHNISYAQRGRTQLRIHSMTFLVLSPVESFIYILYVVILSYITGAH